MFDNLKMLKFVENKLAIIPHFLTNQIVKNPSKQTGSIFLHLIKTNI